MTQLLTLFHEKIKLRKAVSLFMKLNELLKFQREIDGITLKELSFITGICDTLLCRYESGKRNIAKKHMDIIFMYIRGAYDCEVERMKEKKEAS